MPFFNSSSPFYLSILDLAKQQTALNLLDSGVDANFLQPILSIIQDSISVGGNVNDLIDELNTYITGGDKGVGALKRYVTQVSNDSLTQFNANYNQAITSDLGFEFYKYTGTIIADSRPFCRDFVQKYYHKTEVEQLGMRINPFTSSSLTPPQLNGRIAGTNKSSIFTNRGGWQCRHYFSPLSTRQVPKATLMRNLNNGNWNPTEREIDLFLK
jgi:hypothetical protein